MFEKIFAAKRPADLGLDGGLLRRCPADSASCLVSEYADVSSRVEDPHHVMPLVFEGRPAVAMARLASVLAQQPDITVITHSPSYMHAEASTRFGLLVFDLEFRINAGRQQIEIRSASRLPISDLGLNRARIERIRDAFDA